MIFIAFILVAIFGVMVFGFQRPVLPNKINRPPSIPVPSFVFLLKTYLSPHVGKFLARTGRLYGPIIRVGLVSFDMVLLSGPDVVKDAGKVSTLSGRANCLFKEIMNQKGLIWVDDSSQERKTLFRSSKHFSITIVSCQNIVHAEITQVFKHIDSFQGNAFPVKGIFAIPTFNGLAHRFLSETFPHDDPNLRELVKDLHLTSELPGPRLKSCAFAPSLTKWIPRCLSGRQSLEKFFIGFLQLADSRLDKISRTRIPQQPRNLADALLDEVETKTDGNSEKDFQIIKDAIRSTLADLLSAGIHTTAATLEWSILYLSHFPQIQAKLQIEVDNVIGREKLPELSDRANTPYLQAFIQEILRVNPIIPLGFHYALEDTHFRGYTIEKGSYVLLNYYGVHMDPKLWEDPEEFKPERFINVEGKFIKSDLIFSFGSGKRSCVGETTARDQLFLYLTRLLQTYNITWDTKVKSLNGTMGIAYHAPNFNAKFNRRQ